MVRTLSGIQLPANQLGYSGGRH